ncbi:PAS domain S-box protein [candidate division KSB1 bacterium]|nr:PAS domain S-box protein [candidate division KSB1 bacterium]
MQCKNHTQKKSIEEFCGRKISEPFYQELFENAPIGIYQSNPDGIILFANATLAHMMGYASFDELSHLNLESDWYHPDYPRSNFKSRLEKEDRVTEYESLWMKKDGTTIHVRENAQLIRDKKGIPLYYAGTVEDISAQKYIEEAFVREQVLMSAMMDTLPDNIYFKDKDSRFIRINKAMCNWFGIDNPEEAVGKSDYDYFSEEHAQQAYENEQNIIQTGKPLLGIEEKETWPGGKETWVSTTKAPLFDLEGNIIGSFGISRDITDRKSIDRALRKTKDELVKKTEALENVNLTLKRSNQELEQFASVASHDLKEPLRMISSYVKLLEQKLMGTLDEESKEFISYVSDGAQRMQTLISDLLTYSRVTSLAQPFETTDLNLMVERALQNLKVSIEEKEAIITRDDLPTAVVDGIQIERLFQNLISNAMKYCEVKPKVHISSKSLNGEWIITIQDNGIGIDPKYQDIIFDIFKRLHGRNEYSGTGIGLAVCKKIVERHGGEIWVESEKDKGSTFYFTILNNT